MMKVNILDKIERDVNDAISMNKLKINRFASKYENVKTCFFTDEETDDLYNLMYDLSHGFNIPEDELYYMFVECKYTQRGELSKTFEDDFATRITLCETINK
mgnify:CR=1 FL=1